jgi:hypothetical protein
MRRFIPLGILALLILAALWRPPTKSAAAAPQRLVTNINASMSGLLKIPHYGEDSLTMHLNETCTYDITNWSDSSVNLDVVACDTTFTVAGGGASHLPALGPHFGDPNLSWSHAVWKKPDRPLTSVSLDPASKTGIFFFKWGTVLTTDSKGQTSTDGSLAMTALSAGFASAGSGIPGRGLEFTGGPKLEDVQRFTYTPSSNAINISKSASYTATLGDSNGTLSVSYTVTGGANPQVEVEMIPPAQYAQWLPQADENETTLGNYMDIKIVAHKKDDPDTGPPKKILGYKISLVDTSKEKGVDLNWPQKSKSTTDYDMKIDKYNPWIDVADASGQSAQTKPGQDGLTAFTLTVDSFDWGGSTKLQVVAQLEGGQTVTAHVRGQASQTALAIPKDDNANHIADEWESWFGLDNPDEFADDDNRPRGDGTNGDSIALFDEYRGFHIRGRHERLSPATKDLFVQDASDLGTGQYVPDFGVNVHRVYGSERAAGGAAQNEYTVTPNGSHGDTYVIFLHHGNIGKGVVGETDGGPDVPMNIAQVTIDDNEIARGYGTQAAAELQSTITHELGHATNVWHHGQTDYLVGGVNCYWQDSKYTRPSSGMGGIVEHLPCSTAPKKGCYEVAAKGGMYSGNDTCVMRYDMTHFFEDPSGNCQWRHGKEAVIGSKYGQDPPGMFLCRDRTGTGVNDKDNPHNKAGDASADPDRGNCTQKFRLKNVSQ